MAFRGWLGGFAAALALACALLVPSIAAAATISVNTELDFPVAPSDRCSLRAALMASGLDQPKDGCVAGTPGNDTIVVPAGLYALNGALIANGDVTIRGAGAAATIVSQGATDRVLMVSMHSPGFVVTLDGLTLTGGHAANGGDAANVTGVSGSAGNPGDDKSAESGGFGQDGGGVYNGGQGTLTLLNARLTANSAGSGGKGGNARGGAGGFAGGSGLGGLGGIAFGGNGGRGGSGGAIYSLGPVVVRDSTLTANSAGNGGVAGDGTGGDGGSSGGVSLQGRRGGNGSGGDGGWGGEGGAIYAAAPVTVERSVINGNRGGSGGPGGAGVGGRGGSGGSPAGTGGSGATGTGGRGGVGGNGGGLQVNGTLTVAASTIGDNTSGAGGTGGGGRGGVGGAGSNQSGSGWFAGDGLGGDGGPGGFGAGVSASTLSAGGSLFVDNHTGDGGSGGAGEGGVGGLGGFTDGHGNTGGTGTGGDGGQGGDGGASRTSSQSSAVTNTTVTQNSGGSGGSGGPGTGGKGGDSPGTTTPEQGGFGGTGNGGNGASAGTGGLAAPFGDLQVVHATVSSNASGAGGSGGSAAGGAGGSGGSSTGGTGSATGGTSGGSAAGGLEDGVGLLSVTNSIVSSNTPVNCFGDFGNGGHNITFGDVTCPGTSGDPKLLLLADNGGLTRTQALGGGSPALDAVPGSGAGCATADQRGVGRPRGVACDAGAYEKTAPDVATGAANGVSGTGATLTGSVTANAGSASYRFDYGTTTAYGSSTAAHTARGVAPADVSDGLTGLEPDTTYHYRLVATNPDGFAAGADQSFTTARDGTAPRFLSASLKPRKFAVDRRGARERPVAAVARGTTFRFALTEDARVVFTIHRALPGRRVGRRCVKPTARNRSKRACTRYVTPRRFATQAKAAANRKRFSGRIGRRALSPGSYRVTLVARDAAGNASTARRLTFRVVRAR